nr:cytochrome c oxidase subunit 2 [Hydroides norvegica]
MSVLGVVMVLVFGSVAAASSSGGFRPKRLCNSKLEWWWSFLPILVVVLLDIPNLAINYISEKNPFPVFGAKVMGLQWYWQYELEHLAPLNHSPLSFLWVYFILSASSGMLKAMETSTCQIFLKTLSHKSWSVDSYEAKWGLGWLGRFGGSDTRLVLPLNTPCRIIFTGADVIHNFNIKALGFSVDCVPGRLNQHKFLGNKPGVFQGLCSELCGINHPHMPCSMEVLP